MSASLLVRLNTGTCPHVMRLALSKCRNFQAVSQLCLPSTCQTIYHVRNDLSPKYFSTSHVDCQESISKETTIANVTNNKDEEESISHTDEYRERYIPLTRPSMVRYLTEDRDLLTDDEKKILPEFSRALDRAIMNQYRGVLGELKTLFDPINPDKDTVQSRSWSRREKMDNEFWLLQELESVMAKANFHELPQPTVKKFLKGISHDGVMVSVDRSRYDVLRFWVLGHERPKVSMTLTERLTNFVLRRPPREAMEYYKRVVVAVRLKKDSKLILKAFKEVPIRNIEMLLPDGTIQMSAMDKGIMGTSLSIAAIGILAKVVTNLAQYHIDWTLILTGITGTIGFRAWSMYRNKRNEYLIKVTQMLYYKNIANNRGLLALLVDRAEDESFKEALLTYVFLLTSRPSVYRSKLTTGIPASQLGGLTSDELKEKVEKWIEDRAGVKLQFNPTEAILLLTNLGLVSKSDDKIHAIMLGIANKMLPDTPRSLILDDGLTDGFDRDAYLETEAEYKADEKKRSRYGWF